MDRSSAWDLRQGRRGWEWLALATVLFAAGCKPDKPDGSTAAFVGDMKAEELLAHLKLTSVVGEGSRQWALLLLAVPGKPTEHLKLMAGQRVGDLQVLRIDPATETVEVRLGDRDASLSLSTHGLKPGDGYAWLQRLTADEHARLYNSPDRQQLVDDHSQAQEQSQREELARELEEREQLLQPSSEEQPSDPN